MHVAAAMALPTGATLAIARRLARRMAPDGTPVAIGTAPAADGFRAVVPVGVGIVLSALYFRIDVVLLQWWSDAAAVAGYSAVFRLVEALRLFPSAVLAVAMPALVQGRHAGRCSSGLPPR